MVIPVGGTTKYLNQAVDSVRAQHLVKTNLIIVDARGPNRCAPLDIPEDVTLAESPIRLLAGAARNAGLEYGKASLVSFLDADDVWPPSRTHDLVEALAMSQNALAVGKLGILHEAWDVESLIGPEDGSLALLAGGVALSRSLAEMIGPFDEDLRAGEFVDWMARAKSMGVEVIEVDTVSLVRRIHRESATASDFQSRQDYLKVVKKWMNSKPSS